MGIDKNCYLYREYTGVISERKGSIQLIRDFKEKQFPVSSLEGVFLTFENFAFLGDDEMICARDEMDEFESVHHGEFIKLTS